MPPTRQLPHDADERRRSRSGRRPASADGGTRGRARASGIDSAIRAYLRHLTVAGDILSCTLCTIHNLHFYLDLMTQARAHLDAGDYGAWHRAWIERYEAGAAARSTGLG